MAMSEDTLSKFSEHLIAYESACEEDPNLKSFDSSLQKRTTKLIKSLTAQSKSGSLSHMEVYEYLLEVNQVVANFIIESEEEMWENEGIRSMAKAYLDSSTKTLEFFNTLENYVNKAELSQLMIQYTVKRFVKDLDVEGNKKNKYEKVLEELNKFKGVEDPFDDGEFMTQFELVKKHQLFLLEEVSKLKEKLDKESSNKHKGRIFSNVVFAAVFVSAVVATVVSSAIGAPLMVPAVAAVLSLTIPGGVWVKTMLKEYEKAVESSTKTVKNEATESMKEYESHKDSYPLLGESSTKTVKNEATESMKEYESHKDSYPLLGESSTKTVKNEATESINIQVKELITKISSILETVDFAMEIENEDVDTKLALEDIKKRVEGFTEKFKEFADIAAKCRKLIVDARFHVLSKRSVGSAKNI